MLGKLLRCRSNIESTLKIFLTLVPGSEASIQEQDKSSGDELPEEVIFIGTSAFTPPAQATISNIYIVVYNLSSGPSN